VPSYLITVDPADNLFGEDMSLLVTEHAALSAAVILGRERVVAAAAAGPRRPGGRPAARPRPGTTPTPAAGRAHLGYDPARTTT